jgi:hypothetical protein
MLSISVYWDVHGKQRSRNSRQQFEVFHAGSAQYQQADAEELLFRARFNSARMLILSYVERIVKFSNTLEGMHRDAVHRFVRGDHKCSN